LQHCVQVYVPEFNIAMHLFVTMLCSHEPISLPYTMLAVYTMSPNGEYVSVVRVIEDNSAVVTSNMFQGLH